MTFTCNSCNLAFQDAQNQRDHMKGEWHRYNLKRRVAQLPPIDEDSFNTKVAIVKEGPTFSGDHGISKKEERRRKKEAILEQKRQILETARRNMTKKETDQILSNGAHVDDPEHRENKDVEEIAEQADDLTLEEEQEKFMEEKVKNKVDIPITTCLFCSSKQKSHFDNIEDNIQHMLRNHGLYIPETNYLVDREGLIRYLGEKIGLGNVCLCCSYQGKNIEAVRDHMNVKRHMRIPYEKEDEKLEISEFYDFTSSYDDYVGAETAEDQDDGEWEDVSGDEGAIDEDEDLTKNPGAMIDGHELILPSGKILGHRSMQRYYRQNLPPERELSEGQGTLIAAEDRHLLNVRDKKQYNVQKRAWSRELKRADINDRRSAKHINFQPHYRDQLLQ